MITSLTKGPGLCQVCGLFVPTPVRPNALHICSGKREVPDWPAKAKTGCDGLGCNAVLRWKADGSTLAHDGGDALPLNLSDVLAKLRNVLKVGGCNDPMDAVRPTIKNLCPNCWTKQALVWDKDLSTYGPSLGRTTDEGIAMNNGHAEWSGAGGVLYLEKIRSTVVHECMHWVAVNNEAGNNGLQKINRLNVNWDECVTDMLGRLTYKELGFGAYVTGYGDWSEFIDKASKKVNDLPSFKLKGFIAELKDTTKARYPLPVRQIVQTNAQLPSHTSLIEEKLKTEMFKWFVVWDLQGPSKRIADAGGNFDDFLTNMDIVFGILGNTLRGNEIKTYA